MSNNKNCKIYSRNRMKFFKIKHIRGKGVGKNKIGIININIIILIIIFIFVFIYNVIEKSIDSIFKEICEDEANAIATKITNEESTKAMKNYTYNDMFKIEKDESGQIQMINANMITIDEITSNISNYIQEALENSESKKVKVAIGSFSGMKIFAASGPSIPIKISSAGKVNTELKSEFFAKGINQTIHRIYLQIDCEVSILTPFETIKENVSNQVLFAENVIIGNIPDSYYNFQGIEQQNALETIK